MPLSNTMNIFSFSIGGAKKTLHLRHLSPECKQLMNKAGDLVEVNLLEDPTYNVADDRLE